MDASRITPEALATPGGGRHFLRDISVTFGSRVVGLCLAILASVLAARFLGPSGKGALAVIGLISSLAVQFGDLGLHASATYFTARDPDAVPRIAALSLWIGLLMGGLLSLMVLVVARLFPHSLNEIPDRLLLIALGLIPIGLLSLFFQNILLGLQRILAFNLVDLAGKVLGLMATILLLPVLGLGVWELLVAGLAISLAASLATIWLVAREAAIATALDCDLARDLLRYGMKFYLACLFAYLVVRIDLLLVNFFRGVAEAGIYSVAVSVADLLYMLPVSMGTVLFPRIAGERSGGGELTLKTCRYTALVMASLCLAVALLARPVIQLLYGPAFAGSVLPLLWLLPGVFFLSLEVIVANDLAGRGYPAVLVLYWLTGLLVNLGLNAIVIPRWGATGAAATSTVTYALMFALVFRCFLSESGAFWRRALLIEREELEGLYRSVRKLLAFQHAR
jgi:O-antigen/teichoic acid export membrane protein